MKNKLITVAEFSNSFDVKYNLFKDMLEKAGIEYITSNENARLIEGALELAPSNIAIGIKCFQKDAQKATEIFNSID